MLEKQFFVDIMNRLEKQENLINEVDEALKLLDSDFCGFCIPSASSIPVDVLKKCLNDEGDWLDYFIYELDWLKNINSRCIKVDNKYVNIQTWEDVYDFLTDNYDHLLENAADIVEVHSSILDADEDSYIAFCASNDFSLGSGVAKLFDDSKNLKSKLHKLYPNNECSYVGKALEIENMYVLITKYKCSDKTTYENLREALVDLRDKCLLNKVHTLAIPRLGCGGDHLDWEVVKEILNDVFDDIKISIKCYYV